MRLGRVVQAVSLAAWAGCMAPGASAYQSHEENGPDHQPSAHEAPAPQPPATQPSAIQDAPLPTTQEAWAAITSAYRTAPIAERIRLGVIKPRPAPRPDAPAQPDSDRLALEDFLRAGGPDAEEQRGVLFFRVAPSPAGGATAPLLRLEMGDLRVFGESCRLVAARASIPGGVVMRSFEGPVTPEALALLMPPLSLPQLGLALEADPSRAAFMPGLSPPTWNSVSRIKEAGKPRLVLRGVATSPRGEHAITLSADESTHRIASLRVSPPQGEPAPSPALEVFVTPIDPGDPSAWRIETAGKIAVATLDALRSAPPAEPPAPQTTALKPGDLLPQLYLFNARGEAWAGEKTPSARLAGIVPDDASEFRAVLLAYLGPAQGRDPSEPSRRALLARAKSAIESALARAHQVDPDRRIAAAGLAILELEGFDAVRRTALGEWTAAGPAALPQLLCSPAGKSMFATLSPTGDAVVIVVDQSLKVIGVVPVKAPTTPGTPAAPGTQDPLVAAVAELLASP